MAAAWMDERAGTGVIAADPPAEGATEGEETGDDALGIVAGLSPAPVALTEREAACTSPTADGAAAGQSAPIADTAQESACASTAAGDVAADTSCAFSVTAADEDSVLMKADSSSLDCSIISFTQGENLTPEENSPASLLLSGPFDVVFLDPS
jgi:hypothetical protein